MLFLAGAALLAAALFLLVVARRQAGAPDAPLWLQAAVSGAGVALAATMMLACGAGLLVQAAAARGDLAGVAGALAGLALPFVGLWLLARRQAGIPGAEIAAGLPPTGGGRRRRGRTGGRPAAEAAQAAVARQAG